VQESWRTVKMTSTSFPKLIKPWWFLKKMRQLAGIEQNPDWEFSKRLNLYLLVCVVRWWIFSFRVVNVHSQIKSKNKNNIYIYIHRMWRRIWDGALYAFTSQDPVIIYFYFLAYVLSHGMGGEKSRTMVCLKTEQFGPSFF